MPDDFNFPKPPEPEWEPAWCAHGFPDEACEECYRIDHPEEPESESE